VPIRRGYDIACANLRRRARPREDGDRTDSGFAVTPYGEWHARELELFVEDLGFSPAEALRAATATNAQFMPEGDRLGVLEAGRAADFIALDASPLENISVLLDKRRIRAVHLAGKLMSIPERDLRPARSLRQDPGRLDRALHPGPRR